MGAHWSTGWTGHRCISIVAARPIKGDRQIPGNGQGAGAGAAGDDKRRPEQVFISVLVPHRIPEHFGVSSATLMHTCQSKFHRAAAKGTGRPAPRARKTYGIR